jgi:HlyD family secretion protein
MGTGTAGDGLTLYKIVIWVFVIGLIGGGGWFLLKKRANGDELSPIEPEIVQVERGDLRVTVEATGKVVANANVEVKSKASGEILTLPYEEGGLVRVGQLLIELDPDDERRNVLRSQSALESDQARLSQARSQLTLMESDAERYLTQAESALRQAQARQEYAEARHRRALDLYEDGVLSDEEFDVVRKEYEEELSALASAQAAFDDAQTYHLNVEMRRQDIVLAESDLRDAEIALEEANERFEDTRILAPVDGVITDLQVEAGQIIASGISNVGGGTTLMVISDLSRMFIEVKVDETDIGKVETDHLCEIIADAFPEQTVLGHVEWIAPQGEEENNITTFGVRVEIDLPEVEESTGGGAEAAGETVADLGLRPNMTARVEIITADLEDVVLIANEAIQRGEGDSRHVEVVTDEATVEPTRVAEASTPEVRPEPPARMAGRARGAASRPTRGGRGDWDGSRRGDSEGEEIRDEDLVKPPPPTVSREVVLGPSDGIQTHVISGLEEGEEVLVPIPEWRLEFLRRQATGENENNRRRRRMF